MYILIPQPFHSIRVPLKLNPVKLLHGHLMLVEYLGYCGDAYGVDIMEYSIVFYDCSADLTDVLFLLVIEKFFLCLMVIPSLTEHIPVFPAEGLDDGGDCIAGHIRLHSVTCLCHYEATVDDMVHKCGPSFIWDNMVSSCSLILPPCTLTPPPLLPLPRAGSCPAPVK